MPMLTLSASLIVIFAPLAVISPKLLVAFDRVTFPMAVKLPLVRFRFEPACCEMAPLVTFTVRLLAVNWPIVSDCP